jgi:predicted RNase H-like HicB family nuclease
VVLDLNVLVDEDGFTSVIPSIKGCESWASSEEDAIINAVELLRFYLDLPADTEIIVDKARRSKKKVTYKLIFYKD